MLKQEDLPPHLRAPEGPSPLEAELPLDAPSEPPVEPSAADDRNDAPPGPYLRTG
jgi:hypothetical protein